LRRSLLYKKPRSPEMPRALGEKLVIATHNAGKCAELRALLAPYGIAALSAAELGLPEPQETGLSFSDNAIIKAREAAHGANMPALADDSGLCIDALNGAPGVHSARWAGAARDFAAAMKRVESALQEVKAGTRPKAHFTCVLALAFPSGAAEIFEGKVFGDLVFPPRGSLGFGYDPIFVPERYERTFGEMTAEEKHGIPSGGGPGLSHRARAFQAFARHRLEPL
jgi:XTP/dITP diphosphohydrolase